MGKSVIHIYGASGSGTTTLARYLGGRLGYDVMDTDDYYWLPSDPPYTKKREPAERVEMMRRGIEKADRIVVSGSLVDWGDELIPLFSLAVRLVTETNLRIARLRERERRELGSRIEAGGDLYQNHRDFIEWAAAYDIGGLEMRSKAKHDAWEKLLTCRQIVLDGSAPLEYNLEQIKQNLGPCHWG